MNTVYTGMRRHFVENEDKSKKYLHVEFLPKRAGGEVLAKLGRGQTPEEAKVNAQSDGSTKSVSLKGLDVTLGHDLTIYMDEDLNKGVTKVQMYVGNSIAHVVDATLVKQ